MPRTLCAEFATSPEYAEMGLGALIPPLIGIELIGFVRRSFDVSGGPNARYCELGKALLEDVRDDSRSGELRLEQLETYLVRRATLLRHLSGPEIQELIATGLLREFEIGDRRERLCRSLAGIAGQRDREARRRRPAGMRTSRAREGGRSAGEGEPQHAATATSSPPKRSSTPSFATTA